LEEGLQEKGATKMRKAAVTLMVGALVLALTAGVAFAAINCTGGPCFGTNNADTLYGTANVDNIQGLGGDDTIYGKGSNDFLAGDQAFEQTLRGNDKVYGGEGDEDVINCGRGTQDIVRYDVGLDTITNCEIKNPPL
jgi:Ca2+-binding RTX toxin-like protein